MSAVSVFNSFLRKIFYLLNTVFAIFGFVLVLLGAYAGFFFHFLIFLSFFFFKFFEFYLDKFISYYFYNLANLFNFWRMPFCVSKSTCTGIYCVIFTSNYQRSRRHGPSNSWRCGGFWFLNIQTMIYKFRLFILYYCNCICMQS